MEKIWNMLDFWISSTAWPMTPPKAYGPFHLIFTFVGLILCAALAWKLRRLQERGNKILLFSMGAFLAITEVYKQLFYYFYIGNNSYQWWIFPFQLCSVPMYLCMLVPFIKSERIKQGIYGFMMTFNLLGGLMAFIEPSGIIHSYWTLTLHAFIWHMTLNFIGFYIIFSGRGIKTGKDYCKAVVCFLVLCCVAFSINLIFWKASAGSINMFFVGPRNSSLVVFEQISERFGWYVSTILYIPTVCLGAWIVYLPVYLREKKKLKKEGETHGSILAQTK